MKIVENCAPKKETSKHTFGDQVGKVFAGRNEHGDIVRHLLMVQSAKYGFVQWLRLEDNMLCGEIPATEPWGQYYENNFTELPNARIVLE